jgi:hypothetical protein
MSEPGHYRPNPLLPEIIKPLTRNRGSGASIRPSHQKYRSAIATFCEQIAYFVSADPVGDEVEMKL